MKKTDKINLAKGAAAVLAGSMILQLAGCGKSVSQHEENQESRVESQSGEENQPEQETAEAESAEEQKGEQEAAGGISGEYDEDDLNTEWSEGEGTLVACSGTQAEIQGEGIAAGDNGLIISQEGTYVFRGDYQGQIKIDAGKEDVVRLVFDGFSISCENTSPVYGAQCKKLIVTLAEGTENRISDGAHYVFDQEDEDEPDAALFAKDDLTINGTGSLAVEGNYADGIRGKDNVKIISGEIAVTAVDDGIKGKDSLTVKDGNIQVTSGEDGLKSNNDSDPEKGYVIIEGGQILIQAGDDGIHGESWLTIHDGVINIEGSYEGLEAMRIDINGGVISVTAEDDGINGAGSSESEDDGGELDKRQANPDIYVRIAGGQVDVDSGADGIDSNGDLYVTGGTVRISGPESNGDGALDYNGTAQISGGNFAAAGSAGMMQTFSEESSQSMIMVYYEEAQAGGTEISLMDESGGELFSWMPEKTYECLLLSLPELEEGSTYTLLSGEESQEITIEGIITQSGERSGGFGGGRGAGGPREDGPGAGGPGEGGGPGGAPGNRRRGGPEQETRSSESQPLEAESY